MNKQELKEELAIECTTIDRNGSVIIDKTPAEMIDWVYNIIQQSIAEHEAKRKVIKAKAMRKKGTNLWYRDSKRAKPTEFISKVYPLNYNHAFAPYDSELVDIEIRVVEPEEGGQG